MQWFDAYYGFVKLLQPEQNEDSFITIKQLIELFGDEQKYIATIGYENEDGSVHHSHRSVRFSEFSALFLRSLLYLHFTALWKLFQSRSDGLC